MRPLALEPRLLRGILRDLESASDEVAAAAARVVAPQHPHPWRGLVERGVTALLDEAAELVEGCRRLADRLEDSVVDFEKLDDHVAGAASVRR